MLITLLFAALLGYGTSVTGDYYQGDGLGLNWTLTLTADHRYTFVWTGCLGEYGRAEGDWSDDAHILTLKPSRTVDAADRFPLRPYINTGWEPRDNVHGLFFLKDGDETIGVRGRPELPAVNMVLGDQDDPATELHVVSVSAHAAVVECSCDELAAGHRLSTSIYDEAWKP